MAYNDDYRKPNSNSGYQGNRGNYGGSGNQTTAQPTKFETLDKVTYVDKAEKIMKALAQDKNAITTSQIRIILDLINEIYIPVKTSTDPADKGLDIDTKSKLQYTKMKIAYQAGRDNKVKKFVEDSHIMEHIDQVKTKGDMILLAHYTEALVAYHKYHIGG